MVGIKEALLSGKPQQQQPPQNGSAPPPDTTNNTTTSAGEPKNMANTTIEAPSQDMTTTLNNEILAAATYLDKRIESCADSSSTTSNTTIPRVENVLESIKKATQQEDNTSATSTLIDAFLYVLQNDNSSNDQQLQQQQIASLEGCMQELLVWLRKKCQMNDDLVTKLSKGLLLQDSSKFPSLRLRCMTLLYNSVDHPQYQKRFDLLLLTIQLADKLSLISSIVNTIFPKIEGYMKIWNIDIENKKIMDKACYKALKNSKLLNEAFQYNIKLLMLYNNTTDVSVLDEVRNESVEIIIDAVKLPKLYRFDTLLELDSVSRFQQDIPDQPDLKLLHELISIFVRDDLAVFKQFLSKHEDLLTKYNIDTDVAIEKMRLLTFASLGIDSPDLTYEMIAAALQIDEKDVEHWVIRAISSGLVDAKINQLKSSVAIYRSTQRMFTREEWLPLSERINIWKQNIGDLLVALRETRDASGIASAVESLSVSTKS